MGCCFTLCSCCRMAVSVQTKFTGLDKQKFQRIIVNIFLPINFNICFGCSKEPSH